MAWRPDRKRPAAEMSPELAQEAILPPSEEGVEEFKVSVLLHLALLLFLTVYFAFFGPAEIDLSAKTFPVRLIGPLEAARPGSSLVPNPDAGSRENAGSNRQLALGPRKAKVPGKRSVEKTSALAKSRKPKVVGENGKVGRPVKKPDTAVETTVVQNTPETSRSARPYLPGFETDDLTDVLPDRSSRTPMQTAIGGVDLGEPLAAEIPGEESLPPETGGRGTDDAAPSGNPESTNEAGGGAFEIAGLESVGGGVEGFAPPKVISRILPEYPEWARKKGVKGMAVYKVLIQESGTVGDVISLSSTLDAKLAVLGAQALRRWVFSPVLIGGEPKPTWVQLTVQFKLS